MKMPDRWGGGQLFAFSGLDGPTSWATPFVGSLADDAFAIDFHQDPPLVLEIVTEAGAPPEISPEFVLGDCFSVKTPGGLVRVAFADRFTLIGEIPAGLQVRLREQPDELQTKVGFFCLVREGYVEPLSRARMAGARERGGREEDGLLDVPHLGDGAGSSDGSAPMNAPLRGARRDERHSTISPHPCAGSASTLPSPSLRSGEGDRTPFVLALDPHSAEAARDRAMQALAAGSRSYDGLDKEIAHRQEFVASVVAEGLATPADEKTYRKAASVLKVNTMAPEGSIHRRWTTPDRWPHRHMWLWDSCFHALGWLYLDEGMAKDAVAAMVESAYPDGMIPLCSAPTPTPYKVSQPPLLAWTVWEIHQATMDTELPAKLYAGLSDYVNWFFRERDRNHNGLFDWWKDESNTHCHCGESGLDNSPRFDLPGLDDHVDLSCMIYNELECLARLAVMTNNYDDAAEWRHLSGALAERINERMWDEETGFYYDLRENGQQLRMKTIVGFLPMWAGIASEQQCGRLMEHLLDPREFASGFPVPTVALNEPSFSDDMWRGPTWINLNYLLYRGLMRNGFETEGTDLRERTLREIQRWYEETGSIHEFYDSLGQTDPRLLHRKGGVGNRGGYGVGTIGDYGWSAALYLALANEAV